MQHKFVIFKLGAERYGVPIENVERILPIVEVTKLPRSPKMMLGVFEMRGETLPAFDACLRFDLKSDAEPQSFVVVLNESGRCALRVDRVVGIETFEDNEIDEATSLSTEDDEFIRGIGKRNEELTVLLEPEYVVPSSMRKKLAAAA